MLSARAVELAAVLVFATAAAPAATQASAWDAAEVTALSEQLVAALHAFNESAVAEPDKATVLQQRAFDSALATIRHLTSVAETLRRELRLDASYEQTLPLVEQIRGLAEQAAEEAQGMPPTGLTREILREVVRLMSRIAPYYSEDSDGYSDGYSDVHSDGQSDGYSEE